MATNTFNNISMITREALNVLKNQLVLTKCVNRTYDDAYDMSAGRIGDTVNVRVPGYGTSVSGKVAVPVGFQDSYRPVTVAQRNASLVFSSKELALNVEEGEEFRKSVLGPQMAKLCNDIEADGFNLFSGIPNYTGAQATKLDDMQYFLNANALITEHAAPVDDQRYAFISPRSEATMVYGQKALFNSQAAISEQYTKGKIGAGAGLEWYMSQNVKNFTSGYTPSTTAAAMNAIGVEASSTLVVKTLNASVVLKVGDILTVAGVYEVNPVSKESTGQLRQFVVTAVPTGTTTQTILVYPPLYTATSGPLQNIDALPQAEALVSIWGAASWSNGSAKVSSQNLVFHKDAIAFACKDLPQTESRDRQSRVRDRDLGVSLRLTRWYDGRNDDLLFRLDVLYGWALIRPDFACRVIGA